MSGQTTHADGITPVEKMDLVGGELCLDFVNTGSARAQGPFKDKLRGYGDLVTFAERMELVDRAQGQRLRERAQADPIRAGQVLERARALRESIYRAFVAMNAGGAPAQADLDVLAREAAEAASERRLLAGEDCCVYAWPDDDRPERLLWPIAESASELATSERLDRVKECAADNCNWLFLDASRNRSRRWCDMKDCGNRAKARRFRTRHASD